MTTMETDVGQKLLKKNTAILNKIIHVCRNIIAAAETLRDEDIPHENDTMLMAILKVNKANYETLLMVHSSLGY